jgi:ankyrin repeat protein
MVLKTLLTYSAVSVNAQDKFGYTALHWAAKEGSAESVYELLSVHGVQVDIEGGDGLAPLELAESSRRAPDIIQWLRDAVTAAGDIAATIAPLHDAAKQGDAAAVSAALISGIKVTSKSDDGRTALHFAAMQGNDDVVRVLLDAKGVEVGARDVRGHTCLHLAAISGHANVVAALVAAPPDNFNVPDSALNVPDLVNRQDMSGDRTALHFAAMNGGAETVAALLEVQDIDVNAKDIRGQTSLHLAAMEGRTNAVVALLNAGAEINAKDNARRTAMHFAAVKGHAEVLAALLRVADVDLEATVKSKDDTQDLTALQLAEQYGHNPDATALLRVFSDDVYAYTDLYAYTPVAGLEL